MTAKACEDLSTFLVHDLDPVIVALNNKMRDLAIKRQRDSSMLKIASWALYRRSEFKELITSITTLIEHLENLFPSTQSQLSLVKTEITEINDPQALRMVEDAAQNVDVMLYAAAQEALTGHQYSGVEVKGKALIGDAFGSDWKVYPVGPSHTYKGVMVDEKGTGLIGRCLRAKGKGGCGVAG